MNTFMNQLSNATNYKYTENGALAHATTNSAVYDLFALGAAYRQRTEADCLLLFMKAFRENEELALKCLFWMRDCRGGAGERRFFRVCLRWLAQHHSDRIKNLIQYVPEYGRYDDWFELLDTPLKFTVIDLVRNQLMLDMTSNKNGISLLGKWCPSENTSSKATVEKAKKVRMALGMTSKEYRQMLSKLRQKINVLERLMSANEWDKIEFDKIPSRAGLIYKNAFARRDIIAKKYEAFAKDTNTKVNASVLYPYEVVNKAQRVWNKPLDDTDRLMVNKYWENLADYLNGQDCSMMCVVDTSGSMTWGQGSIMPIDVAISLGLYCAERIGGPFKDHYISFASRPQLIKTEGVDFVDKVRRIYKTNLCDNTNLEAVFDLLLNVAKNHTVKKEDLPKTITVISDMEINEGTMDRYEWGGNSRWNTKNVATTMEQIRQKWAKEGFKLPKLVYWNVNARNDTILDLGPNVSLVSGASPTLFKQVLTGKTGYDLMLETICSNRYEVIK